MSIKILLADDHQIMRDGLRALLEQQAGITVVAEANTGRLALQLAQEIRPDVVIMDISMPELNGIDATRQFTAILPAIKVLILSMHADRGFVTGAFQAGAAGFLLKDCTTEELIRAVHTVVAHQIYLSPSLLAPRQLERRDLQQSQQLIRMRLRLLTLPMMVAIVVSLSGAGCLP